MYYAFYEFETEHLTFSSLQAIIRSESENSPPGMALDIDFHVAFSQFDFFIPGWSFVPNFILSSSLGHFYA